MRIAGSTIYLRSSFQRVFNGSSRGIARPSAQHAADRFGPSSRRLSSIHRSTSGFVRLTGAAPTDSASDSDAPPMCSARIGCDCAAASAAKYMRFAAMPTVKSSVCAIVKAFSRWVRAAAKSPLSIAFKPRYPRFVNIGRSLPRKSRRRLERTDEKRSAGVRSKVIRPDQRQQPPRNGRPTPQRICGSRRR